jgi:hypothetical protein
MGVNRRIVEGVTAEWAEPKLVGDTPRNPATAQEYLREPPPALKAPAYPGHPEKAGEDDPNTWQAKCRPKQLSLTSGHRTKSPSEPSKRDQHSPPQDTIEVLSCSHRWPRNSMRARGVGQSLGLRRIGRLTFRFAR